VSQSLLIRAACALLPNNTPHPTVRDQRIASRSSPARTAGERGR